MHCNGESPCPDQNVLRSQILIKLCISHLFHIHISNEWVINDFLPSTCRANIICIKRRHYSEPWVVFYIFISPWVHVIFTFSSRRGVPLSWLWYMLVWCGGRPTHSYYGKFDVFQISQEDEDNNDKSYKKKLELLKNYESGSTLHHNAD